MAWKSNDHMMAGCAAAAKSPRTPKHLVPHLTARLGAKPKKAAAPKKMPAMASKKNTNPFYGE